MMETLRKGLLTAVLGIAGGGMLVASAQEVTNENWKDPISNPVYNDSAELKNQLDLQYMWQTLPSHVRTVTGAKPNLDGDMNVVSLQLEYRLNERWSLLANKTGYIDFNPGDTLNKREGFANVAGGFKYGFWPTQMERLSCAFRTTLEAPVGDDQVFQDGAGNISPAVIATYEMDRFALNGVLGGIMPFDASEQSSQGYLSLDAAAKLTERLSSHLEMNWFRVIEQGHGDADYDSHAGIENAVGFEGGDLINLGAAEAEQHKDFVTAALGMRYQLLENVNMGVAYEIPLTPKELGLMDERVTANVSMRF